jgi:curli biogenesis system outer membrane secretion channel CsgG
MLTQLLDGSRLTRLGCLVTVAVLLLAPGTSAAQTPNSPPPTQKLRVAVADLSGTALKMQSTTMPMGQPQPGYGQPASQTNTTIALPPPAEFARGLTEMLTSVLIKTGRVTVLERSAMQQLDAEQALTAAGKVTKESGAQQGALLGAHAIITGDITGFTFNKSAVGGGLTILRGFSVSGEKVSAEVTIDLRLIDASSGEVIYSAKGNGKADQTVFGADLTKGDKPQSLEAQVNAPLGQASRDAIQNAVTALLVGMPKLRWSGRVIDVRNGTVYVNAAAADGMRPGLELEVCEAQPLLVDPSTGQSLGAPERHVATIVIDSVFEKFSTAKISSGDGIARGHVLRFKPN